MNEHHAVGDRTTTRALRTAIVALIRHSAMEDERLLVSELDHDDVGSAQHWAPIPTVAHNTHFKREQVIRLEAVLHHEAPPEFAAVDHSCERTYRAYAQLGPAFVAEDSRGAAGDLVDSLLLLPDADLLDPSRHEWLRGRALWLQIIVRGFWHPMGHIGDWYIANAMLERGVALRQHAVAMAEYLDAPAEARGVAWYSLACTCAATGRTHEAVDALERAAALNNDLRSRIATEPDFGALLKNRRVAVLIGQGSSHT